ncbi:hypothetical protein RF679_15630 [Undibacterium cyanobacteriorum]|uniref:Uncharacterized protein n=1 Tax=Undibacterium cyanobacteriorum TaxID=3073561 RepID=A0ABY9RHC6_9BURK|nr:hypothetical protein [Undibacterium sp. 20NA77.5]WMW80064.1 hypothetical protein RF679_15630 [Undibacterium sp. 20NA77.5]
MKKRIQKYLIIIALLAAVACEVLLHFSPVFPKSYVGWIALVFVGVPFMLCVEELGAMILSPKFIASWSRGARISYAVIAMVIMLIVLIPAFVFVAYLIGS